MTARAGEQPFGDRDAGEKFRGDARTRTGKFPIRGRRFQRGL